MGARGVKGTESIPVWYLPFRFFDTLWKGNPLAPFYCIFAVVGIFTAWRATGRGHRPRNRVRLVWLWPRLYLAL
jgi:hypothetical protein